jgi:hypothetical protein
MMFGRASRVILLAAFVAVALLGAAVTSALTLFVLGPATGAFFASKVARTRDGFRHRHSVDRSVIWSGVGGMLLVPYFAGITMLGAVGRGLTLALLALCAGEITIRIRSWDHQAHLSTQGGTDMGTMAPSVGLSPTGELMGSMVTSRLLEQWHSSEEELYGGDPHRRLAAVQLRALLLDELSRRDPAGIERWVMDDGVGPPPQDLENGREEAT